MSEKEKKGISPEIVAALIGVAGTIVAGIFFSGGGGSSEPPAATSAPVVITATFMPTAVPTDTVPAGEPTSTPAPTDTPAPEPTDVPPVPIGEDWAQGCISTLWQPYPSDVTVVDKGDGCLQEPVHVFAADNGVLSFIGSRDGLGSVQDYGLFAPLPESGSVSFQVSVKELTNVDVWVGVFDAADIKSNGLLMTIPAGSNVKKRSITLKDPFTYVTKDSSKDVDQGNGFSITFTFNTLSVTGNVNPFVFITAPFSMPSTNKWIYFGYRGLSGSYRVEGSIHDFVIE